MRDADIAKNTPPGLVLVGYRGTGKTTVGRLVADRLGRPFVDLDRECETIAGKTIADLFAEHGEPFFRDLEERTIRDVCSSRRGAVIASGGGAILRPTNRHRLANHGLVVWLAAPPEVLADRLSREPLGRPPLTPAGLVGEIHQVLADREPLYREVAGVVVETAGLRPEDVADRVIAHLPPIGAGR